jgi:hypothetical protein
MKREPPVNVRGSELASCSNEPLTGFFRDGCCNTADADAGCHTVCAVLTRDFLEFSRSRGNDLMTPRPAFDFPGLNEGDRWCLCASRWLEAYRAGCAPRVVLEATHRKTLEIVPLAALESHAVNADH